jgi:preprotein translocase subunit YajC
MLIAPAYAQDAAAAGAGFDLMSFLPLILIFVVFYFLLIRPQQQKMKQHRAMVSGVRRGDHVITAGGIYGKVTRVLNDAEALVEIADGIRVRVVKSTISEVLTKPLPAAPKSDSDEEDEAEAEEEAKEPATASGSAGRAS